MDTIGFGGFTSERQGLSQGVHTFVSAALSVGELLSVIDAQPFAFSPCVVTLALQLLSKRRQGLPLGFYRMLRGRGFSASSREIGAQRGCFGCGLVGRFSCGVDLGLQALAFFLGAAAGLVEFAAQRDRGLALTLGRLVRCALGRLGRSRLELSGTDVLACPVKLGIALRELVSVVCLSGRQLLLGRGYGGLGLTANLGDLGLCCFAYPRRFGDGLISQCIGFFAFTFGGPGALLGQSCRPLSGGAAPLSLSHLGKRVAVRILDLCTRGLDIAGGTKLDHQVVKVPAEICQLLREFGEALLQGGAR